MNPPHRQLAQNALRIPLKDGSYHYLTSRSVHDYVTFGRGKKEVSCDGGLEYCHWGGNPGTYEDWCLYTDSPFDLFCTRLLWGTYGLNPTRERLLQGHLWKPLAECDLDHLKAIKATQTHIRGKLVERVVDHWIAVKESAIRSHLLDRIERKPLDQ